MAIFRRVECNASAIFKKLAEISNIVNGHFFLFQVFSLGQTFTHRCSEQDIDQGLKLRYRVALVTFNLKVVIL